MTTGTHLEQSLPSTPSHVPDPRSTDASTEDEALLPESFAVSSPVLEAVGSHYVKLMRQAVLHPEDEFHQDAVEQIDRLCGPWRTMDSADLRSVLAGIHDELLILLSQFAPRRR